MNRPTTFFIGLKRAKYQNKFGNHEKLVLKYLGSQVAWLIITPATT
jgi:hypothetical protein